MLNKRSDSVVEAKPGSVVSGLQGLKFGISLSSASDNKGIKPLGDTNVPAAAKKFFNNIESKSWKSKKNHLNTAEEN